MYRLFDWTGEKAIQSALDTKYDTCVFNVLHYKAHPTCKQLLDAMSWVKQETFAKMIPLCQNVNEKCMYGYSGFTGYLVACCPQNSTFAPNRLPIQKRPPESFHEMVKLFIYAGANLQDEFYNQGSYEWIDSPEYNELMQSQKNYVPDYLGCTPLHLIASIGDVAAAESLLIRGVDVNAKTLTGTTPLMWAVEQNHADMARFLIKHGADINHQSVSESVKKLDHPGATALSIAVENEATDCTELLLQKGADPTINFARSDGKVMCAAAQTGNFGVLLGLYIRGYNVQNGQYNPLAAAVKNPERLTVEMIEWLSEHDVDFNEKNNDGLTPLHAYLHEVFANGGLSPYYMEQIKEKGECVLQADKEQLALKMIQCGADINAQDNDGKTLLHKAYRQSDIDFLVAGKADLSIKDNFGFTPLMQYALSAIHQEGHFLREPIYFPLIVRLMEYGADINAQDNEGKTLLHYVETVGDLEFLVQNGADVSIKDNFGKLWSDYVPEHKRARIIAQCEKYQKEAEMSPNGPQKIDSQNVIPPVMTIQEYEKENM